MPDPKQAPRLYLYESALSSSVLRINVETTAGPLAEGDYELIKEYFALVLRSLGRCVEHPHA